MTPFPLCFRVDPLGDSLLRREESTLWKVLEEAKFYNIQSLIDCVKVTELQRLILGSAVD